MISTKVTYYLTTFYSTHFKVHTSKLHCCCPKHQKLLLLMTNLKRMSRWWLPRAWRPRQVHENRPVCWKIAEGTHTLAGMTLPHQKNVYSKRKTCQNNKIVEFQHWPQERSKNMFTRNFVEWEIEAQKRV